MKRTPRPVRVPTLLLGLVLGLGAPALHAQIDTAALKALVEQGRFWETRDQPDRAATAWERVLAADPRHPEALARLSALSAQSGDPARARVYLDRLRAAAPGSALLRDAEKAVADGAAGPRSQTRPDAALMARARAAVAAKDYDTALGLYREAMGGEPAGGPHALEYYQTLGATEKGWPRALEFMRELDRKNPGNPATQLALAQHLTYREPTRREGIDKLAALQGNAAVGAQAQKSWQQALVWLQGTPADAARYQRYLSTAGDDDKVQEKYDQLANAERLKAAQAYGARVRGLFSQVDQGELAQAEAGFNSLLRENPGNSDALGGLGVLRLRQQRYDEARSLLQKAQSAAPTAASRWQQALRAASFWSRVQTGERARLAGDFEKAEADYAAAFAAPPDEVPAAVELAYVDVLLNRRKETVAEPLARGVLAREPANPDALRALLSILARTERHAEALTLAQNAPPELQTQVQTLRADHLRRQAAAARAQGDLPGAERLLSEALLQQSDNPWVRLELAEIYRAQGKAEEAGSLLESLAASHGDRLEVRMAQAYFEAERRNWAQVLSRLQTLPPEDRSPEARALQRRAWVQYQLERARQAMQRGEPGEAYRIMSDTDTAAAGDAELLAALAGGWAELRDPARAVAYMRKVMSLDGGATPAARIQYAALLLSAGQDGEFEVVAEDLARRAVLNGEQQAELDQLVVGYRVRLADRARESRDFAGAYVQLRDAVSRYPSDARVQTALARLLTDARDTDAAASIYRSLIEREPENLEFRGGLVDALLAGKRHDEAREQIDLGQRADPDSARWWRLSGRLAEQEGRRGAALTAYRKADKLERGVAGPEAAPQLAWIDSRQPDQGLPGPVLEVLGSSAPDASGPLSPRAASVALAPIGAGFSSPTSGMRSLRMDEGTSATETAGVWQAPAVDVPLWLRSDPSLRLAQAGSNAPTPDPVSPSQRSIATLEASTSGWTGGAFTVRSRDGEGGLSELSNIETPITWTSSETEVGRFHATITPVYLDAGAAGGRRLLRLGTGALVNASEDQGTRDASGVAFGLGYEFGSFEADIGVTPLGFEEDRLVGGLRWSANPGRLRVQMDLSRRAVSESLLSYAGAEDPLLGRTWGGVSRSGGRLDLAFDTGSFGLYGYGGFYGYDGRNVDSNSQILAGAGLFRRWELAPNQTLTYGINLTMFGFEDNRRFFTFGHGGYFSPQQFTAFALPIQWSGSADLLSWNLSAALGIQNFREDGAAFYPGFDGLQEELERLARLEPDRELETGYGSQRNSGLGYTLQGTTEYRIAPQLSVGGFFSVDNARDFREVQAQGYLRYYFTRQPLVAVSPDPILPFYRY